MKNNLISIIIPTYNRASLIGETLDSVKNQTYQNWECIIVDDGSTDGTAHVVKKYTEEDSRFRYVKRPDSYKPGGNGARNYGFKISNGDFVNWFDDDDVMLHDFLLNRISSAFNGLLISSHYLADQNLKVIKTVNIKKSVSYWEDYILWKENFRLVTGNVMFSKSLIRNYNISFNENILRGQEAELLSTLFFNLSENQIKIIPTIDFLYRQHNGTKTKNNNKYNPKFKNDEINSYAINFSRAVELQNIKVINYLYDKLLVTTLYSFDVNSKNYHYGVEILDTIVGENIKKWDSKRKWLKFLELFPKCKEIIRVILRKYLMKIVISD